MVQIAHNFSVSDWQKHKVSLASNMDDCALWNQALDVFESRMDERYIEPVQEMQNNLNSTGEGFSVVAILCSLIEALETFYEGKCFNPDGPANDYEYGNGCSGQLFTSFLKNKSPFSNSFNQNLAIDFYKNVRCALLHEAMTRNGWVIRVDTNSLIDIRGNKKILNRNILLAEIKDYIKEYRTSVLQSSVRKQAFIRKMDGICENV